MRLKLFPYISALASTLAMPAFAESPTFTRDVLPILQEHCQTCHRPQQIGPMSLQTYEETRPWAKAIRTSVSTKIMPPFHANSPLGTFDNDTRITPEQIATVKKWVDAGAPRGNPADAPPPIAWPNDEWTLGKPDLVLEFPAYTCKTNNKDEEVVLYSDYKFPDRTWIRAFEFKPSDNRMVHHAGVFAVDKEMIVPPDLILDSEDELLDQFSKAGAGKELLHQSHMFTWLPGQRVQPWPDGSGIVVAKRDRLVIQTHIPPMTEPVTFTVKLGIWFVNGYMDELAGEMASEMKDLVVPANDPSFVKHEKYSFSHDATIYGYTIHMHLRGKSSQIIFHYPDGTSETAFDLPNFNFDWQRIYWLTQPKKIPSGTEVEYIAEWDNSTENPLNPDPNVDVPWGARTTDEMYGGHVFFTMARQRPVMVKDGVVVPQNAGPKDNASGAADSSE